MVIFVQISSIMVEIMFKLYAKTSFVIVFDFSDEI
jgi:hypothetical protein